MLACTSPEIGAFTPQDHLLVRLLANCSAPPIERARLRRLAMFDDITMAFNNRYLYPRVIEEMERASRSGGDVSLLYMDLDHFKLVNDTYGHPVGDQVLKGVARILKEQARDSDVVARYGGEEFAIVMSETDEAGATVIAERIRDRVARIVHRTPQGPLQVTISLGTATFPDDARTKAELIERADGCLYHAKRHGRNQTVSAASLRGPRRAASAG